MLVAAGYFRARLAIDPFDKILGGMCWCITGSNNEIELEFEDDLKLG
jgi:CCDC93, coiled-coil domain